MQSGNTIGKKLFLGFIGVIALTVLLSGMLPMLFRQFFTQEHVLFVTIPVATVVGMLVAFALAKSLTPGYAIGVCFENITAAQAIREIVRRCLYDLWVDFGEIKMRAYLGTD